jgi:broad specificity phosphatase PhoE
VSISGPSLILLVRHGATEWSAQGRHTGRTDVGLSERGREETVRLRPVLYRLIDSRHSGDPPNPPIVFSSTLARALQTAELAMPEAEPVEAHQLVEVDYGEYEGLTTMQIHERDPDWNLFLQGCPGGESVAAVSARCDSFIAKMERMAVGRTVVAFTHGHFSRILTARMLGLPATAGSVFYNETATIGVLDHRRGDLVLTGWNIAGD